MELLTLIKIVFVFTGLYYFSGFVAVWIFEMKIGRAYRFFHQKVENLSSCRISMAVLHARIFKLEHDYHKKQEMLAHTQQVILKLMLVNRKFVENKKKIQFA